MPAVGLIESCLRHGQQTLLSSRLRTRHVVGLARELNGSGLAGLEVFGGATFGVALSNLGEDPFERLRAVRAATSLPLYGLIRGQSLVANRPVADDVVDLFITTVAQLGLDVFRCFDPLNDVRNLARVVAAVRAAASTPRRPWSTRRVRSTPLKGSCAWGWSWPAWGSRASASSIPRACLAPAAPGR